VPRDPVTLVDSNGNRAFSKLLSRRRSPPNDRTLAAAVPTSLRTMWSPDGVQVELPYGGCRAPEKHTAPGSRRRSPVGACTAGGCRRRDAHPEGLVALPGPRAFVAEQFDRARELAEAQRPPRQYFEYSAVPQSGTSS